MKRWVVVFFCLSAPLFGLDWVSLDGGVWTFLLETESGTFTLVGRSTNYLYSEGKTYPATSFFVGYQNGDRFPLGPGDRSLGQQKPWQRTNHILWSRFLRQGVIYTPAIFLTNRGGTPFLVLATLVSNTTSEAQDIGFAALLDTTLEENSARPLFWFENGASVSNETEITINQYGQYIMSGDGKSGLFLIPYYNGFSPRAIYLANYHRLKTAGATVTIEPGAGFVYGLQGKRDGAIMVEYRYRLRGGESVEGGIVIATQPIAPLQWNATLFDFLLPLRETTPVASSPQPQPASSPSPEKPRSSLTNMVYLTNTIVVTRGDTNYLALQEALIERLESLIRAATNLSLASSSNRVVVAEKPSFSSTASWFPSEDPFEQERNQASSAVMSPRVASNPAPTNTGVRVSPPEPEYVPQPVAVKESPVTNTVLSPALVFVTNTVTNYVTLTNDQAMASVNSALIASYENQIQQLQKQLLEIESQKSARQKTSGKLVLIDRRLELLNWLLEKSTQVNLSAEDIARMNAEIDTLLRSLSSEATP